MLKSYFRRFVFIGAFVFYNFCLYAQPPEYSLFLIGDTGADTVASPALQLLHDNMLKYDYNSAVIFLGDNVYPDGFNIKHKQSVKKLNAQLNLLKDYHGYVCFIPGNHDWKSQKKGGLKATQAQAEYIEAYLTKNRPYQNKLVPPFQPRQGLPGIGTYAPKQGLRFVLIDTQWFLQCHKVGVKGSRKETEKQFYVQLDSLLSASLQKKEQVIIMAHHPLFTNGYHSNKRQPMRFLVNYTPFQIFGLMGLNRLYSQDLAQPRYKKMRNKILSVLNKYPNVIYASGHEHNLQYFKNNHNKYIVSGAGSKLTKLKKRKLFKQEFESDTKTGFFKIEFYAEAKMKIIIYRVGEEPVTIDSN